MADPDRNPSQPLIETLERTGHRFSFFQIVSLLERGLHAEASVGEQGPAAREVVRFTASPSMGFAPGDVASVTYRPGTGPNGEEQDRYLVEATFLGLYGPASPLPPYVNEAITSNAVESDAMRSFLDVFNNRLLGLIYRIWRRYRHHQVFDGAGHDEITRLIASLTGSLDLVSKTDADELELLSKQSLLSNASSAGLFCHSATVLERIIESSIPGVRAQVEELVLRKAVIVDEQRWRLGRANSALFDDAVLGARTPDISGKFRIWLGPLDLDEYQALLPGAEWRLALEQVIRRILRDHLMFDIVLMIRTTAAPAWKLGGEMALGRTAWLGRPSKQDCAVAFVGAR